MTSSFFCPGIAKDVCVQRLFNVQGYFQSIGFLKFTMLAEMNYITNLLFQKVVIIPQMGIESEISYVRIIILNQEGRLKGNTEAEIFAPLK